MLICAFVNSFRSAWCLCQRARLQRLLEATAPASNWLWTTRASCHSIVAILTFRQKNRAIFTLLSRHIARESLVDVLFFHSCDFVMIHDPDIFQWRFLIVCHLPWGAVDPKRETKIQSNHLLILLHLLETSSESLDYELLPLRHWRYDCSQVSQVYCDVHWLNQKISLT